MKTQTAAYLVGMFTLLWATLASGQSSLPGNWVSATANGLHCDGSTDDTSALNSLISSTMLANGGNILFPAGVSCVFGGTVDINVTALLNLAWVTLREG